MSDGPKSDAPVFPNSTLRGADGALLVVLHGTRSKRPFAEFRPGTHKRGMQLGFGLHFAEDRRVADHYGADGGRVLECVLDVRKLLDVTGFIKPGTEAYEFGKALYRGSRHASFWKHQTLDDGSLWLNLDLFDSRRVERMLREHGYDAVKYTCKIGSRVVGVGGLGVATKLEGAAYLVLDPSQVRVVGPGMNLGPVPAEPEEPEAETGLRMR